MKKVSLKYEDIPMNIFITFRLTPYLLVESTPQIYADIDHKARSHEFQHHKNCDTTRQSYQGLRESGIYKRFKESTKILELV